MPIPNVITGIESTHDNDKEDRRFGFQYRAFEDSSLGLRVGGTIKFHSF